MGRLEAPIGKSTDDASLYLAQPSERLWSIGLDISPATGDFEPQLATVLREAREAQHRQERCQLVHWYGSAPLMRPPCQSESTTSIW